jgi:hypothetical protein
MVTAATSATRGSPDALRVGAVAMIAAAIGSAVLCVGWTGRPKAALIPVVYAGVVWTMLKRAVATPAPGTPPARHPWLKTLVRF